jgi:hypothetical protein
MTARAMVTSLKPLFGMSAGKLLWVCQEMGDIFNWQF